MIRRQIFPLIITCLLTVTTISGCFVFGPSQDGMKAVLIAAIAKPNLDISETELLEHPGAVPFYVEIIIRPVNAQEKFFIDVAVDEYAALGERGEEEIYLSVQGNNLDYIDDVAFVDFAFESDGLCFSSEQVELLLGEIPICSVCPPEVNQAYKDYILPSDALGYSIWNEVNFGEGEKYWIEQTFSGERGDALHHTIAGESLDWVDDPDTLNFFPEGMLLIWDSDPSKLPEYIDVPIAPFVTVNSVEPSESPEGEEIIEPEIVITPEVTTCTIQAVQKSDEESAGKYEDYFYVYETDPEEDPREDYYGTNGVEINGVELFDFHIVSLELFNISQLRKYELPYSLWIQLQLAPELPSKNIKIYPPSPVEKPHPLQEPPQDTPPAEETLYVAFDLSGQCTSSQSGCTCTVSYSVDAEDRSAWGKYPVTNVKFEVNDGSGWKVWHNSGPISTSAYHYADQETEVDCDKTFNVKVTATNSIGQPVTAIGSFTTSSP